MKSFLPVYLLPSFLSRYANLLRFVGGGRWEKSEDMALDLSLRLCSSTSPSSSACRSFSKTSSKNEPNKQRQFWVNSFFLLLLSIPLKFSDLIQRKNAQISLVVYWTHCGSRKHNRSSFWNNNEARKEEFLENTCLSNAMDRMRVRSRFNLKWREAWKVV